MLSIRDGYQPRWVVAGASNDLEMGHLAQIWLAISDDSAATVSGG